jgi:hypothetical protein
MLSYRKDISKVVRSQCCVWPFLTYGASRSAFKKVDMNITSLEGHFVQSDASPRALGHCNDVRCNTLCKVVVVVVECPVTAWGLFNAVVWRSV